MNKSMNKTWSFACKKQREVDWTDRVMLKRLIHFPTKLEEVIEYVRKYVSVLDELNPLIGWHINYQSSSSILQIPI
jgi:hypothetical protein